MQPAIRIIDEDTGEELLQAASADVVYELNNTSVVKLSGVKKPAPPASTVVHASSVTISPAIQSATQQISEYGAQIAYELMYDKERRETALALLSVLRSLGGSITLDENDIVDADKYRLQVIQTELRQVILKVVEK